MDSSKDIALSFRAKDSDSEPSIELSRGEGRKRTPWPRYPTIKIDNEQAIDYAKLTDAEIRDFNERIEAIVPSASCPKRDYPPDWMSTIDGKERLDINKMPESEILAIEEQFLRIRSKIGKVSKFEAGQSSRSGSVKNVQWAAAKTSGRSPARKRGGGVPRSKGSIDLIAEAKRGAAASGSGSWSFPNLGSPHGDFLFGAGTIHEPIAVPDDSDSDSDEDEDEEQEQDEDEDEEQEQEQESVIVQTKDKGKGRAERPPGKVEPLPDLLDDSFLIPSIPDDFELRAPPQLDSISNLPMLPSLPILSSHVPLPGTLDRQGNWVPYTDVGTYKASELPSPTVQPPKYPPDIQETLDTIISKFKDKSKNWSVIGIKGRACIRAFVVKGGLDDEYNDLERCSQCKRQSHNLCAYMSPDKNRVYLRPNEQRPTESTPDQSVFWSVPSGSDNQFIYPSKPKTKGSSSTS